MKILSKMAIGAVLVLLLGAAIQPAWGACTTARTIGTGGAFLVSNPHWGGGGGTRDCTFEFGCYLNDLAGGVQGPPISTGNFVGTFWAFPGYGVPGPGGIDNGTWDSDDWTKSQSLGGPNPYYYPAFLTLPGGPNISPGNPPNWGGSALVDGCITDSFTPGEIDAEECTCMLLTDSWSVCVGGADDTRFCASDADCAAPGVCRGVGYFAVLSAFTDALGDFANTLTTTDAMGDPTIILSPIPQPQIVSAVDDTGQTMVEVLVGDLPGASVQTDGLCHCGAAMKVYSWRQAHSGAPNDTPTPPTNRNVFCTSAGQLNCWDVALSALGGTQAPHPFGPGKAAAAIVRVDCNPAAQEDLFLSTRLVMDPASGGGFEANNVSANSFWVACGDISNVAEPNRPGRDKPRGRSDEAPRGRGINRGRGQR